MMYLECSEHRSSLQKDSHQFSFKKAEQHVSFLSEFWETTFSSFSSVEIAVYNGHNNDKALKGTILLFLGNSGLELRINISISYWKLYKLFEGLFFLKSLDFFKFNTGMEEFEISYVVHKLGILTHLHRKKSSFMIV